MADQAGKRTLFQARPLADYVTRLLSPVVERRAGMTMDLVAAWEEIAGPQHAAYTRPEKLRWPRRANEDDPFEPATLIVACDGARAIFFQHETGPLIQRVNTFFGFTAVKSIKLVQKPVMHAEPVAHPPPVPPLSDADRATVGRKLETIEDEKLKSALGRLAQGVFSDRSGGRK